MRGPGDGHFTHLMSLYLALRRKVRHICLSSLRSHPSICIVCLKGIHSTNIQFTDSMSQARVRQSTRDWAVNKAKTTCPHGTFYTFLPSLLTWPTGPHPWPLLFQPHTLQLHRPSFMTYCVKVNTKVTSVRMS